jgi:hypothetical protein
MNDSNDNDAHEMHEDGQKPYQRPPDKASTAPFVLILAVQACMVGVMTFVPFGFDHRSSWGLDFDHFVCLAFFCVLALALGSVLCAIGRRPGFFAAQFGIIAVFWLMHVVYMAILHWLGFR